jgi:hypothetical protein
MVVTIPLSEYKVAFLVSPQSNEYLTESLPPGLNKIFGSTTRGSRRCPQSEMSSNSPSPRSRPSHRMVRPVLPGRCSAAFTALLETSDPNHPLTSILQFEKYPLLNTQTDCYVLHRGRVIGAP